MLQDSSSFLPDTSEAFDRKATPPAPSHEYELRQLAESQKHSDIKFDPPWQIYLNHVADLLKFNKRDDSAPPISEFPYRQSEYILQNSWLLSVACSLSQIGLDWLNTLYFDDITTLKLDGHTKEFRFTLGNPKMGVGNHDPVEVVITSTLPYFTSAYNRDVEGFVCSNWNQVVSSRPKPKTGPFWFLLLEKAVAQMIGSYGDLQGGDPRNAFHILTKPQSLTVFSIPDPTFATGEAFLEMCSTIADRDDSSFFVVAQIRADKLRETSAKKGSKGEILSHFDQYCTVLGCHKAKPGPLKISEMPKWIFKVKDFYNSSEDMPFKNPSMLSWALSYAFIKELGFSPARDKKTGISFMTEKVFCEWFQKLIICQI